MKNQTIIILLILIGTFYLSAHQDSPTKNVDGVVNIPSGHLNIRRGPDLTESVIAKAYKGDIVKIFEKQGEWYKIRMIGKEVGYAYHTYIEILKPISSDTSSEAIKTAQIIIPNNSFEKDFTGNEQDWHIEGHVNMDVSAQRNVDYANSGNHSLHISAPQNEKIAWVRTIPFSDKFDYTIQVSYMTTDSASAKFGVSFFNNLGNLSYSLSTIIANPPEKNKWNVEQLIFTSDMIPQFTQSMKLFLSFKQSPTSSNNVNIFYDDLIMLRKRSNLSYNKNDRFINPPGAKVERAFVSSEKIHHSIPSWQESWNVLMKTKDGYTIKPKDIIMYKLPDYEPLIQHTEDASVRYYFKMITGIQPGSIETIFDGNKYIPKQTNMDNSIKLQLSNKKIFKLFVDFNVETMKRSGTGEFFYAPLILQHESKRQILNTYYLKKYGVNRYNFYTDGPCLYWAGDIDRDGYLDLILNLYDDGHHAGITFFMSSQAGYNKLIKKVFEDYDHSE